MLNFGELEYDALIKLNEEILFIDKVIGYLDDARELLMEKALQDNSYMPIVLSIMDLKIRLLNKASELSMKGANMCEVLLNAMED